MAIDAKDYVKQKVAGKVKVGDSGPDNAAITLATMAGKTYLWQRKWNPDTGEEIDPYMTPVELESLIKQRDQLQVNLDGINAVIADVESLNESKG